MWDVTKNLVFPDYHWIISTHTSRVGCDYNTINNHKRSLNFYSHIPCGMWREPSDDYLEFYRISTHTSRVGCDECWTIFNRMLNKFLLTHPVWDVTFIFTVVVQETEKFLLTHPVWDVTKSCDNHWKDLKFLLTHPVWDVTTSFLYLQIGKNFYSHIPCGMWQETMTSPTLS